MWSSNVDLCAHQHTCFSKWVSVIHFWSQWTCGRSPTNRHVSWTHRVALDWLFDRINLEPRIQIKNVDQKKNNLLTCWLKKASQEMNGITLFVRSSHFSDFFLTIKLESRAPCQKRVKLRLRMKAFRWWKRDHAWWRAARGVTKSLLDVWDLWSTRRIAMKEKKSE